MAKESIWPTVAAERRALAADLAGLTDEQWDAESGSAGWSVRDVVAHMTGTAKLTPLGFLGKMITSGFSLKKLQARAIAAERGSSPADTLSRFSAVADSRKHPPGPTDTWLGEVLVHADDIRRPLGIAHDYPAAACARVADSYKRSNLVLGAKKRIAGLRLRATDTDWSHGAGAEVAGPMHSLLVAMTGRQAATTDLSGDGVATLAQRA